MAQIISITETFVSKIGDEFEINTGGETPAIHIIFDTGEEELHIIDNIAIIPLSRIVINSIVELFKRSNDSKFYPIPSRPSDIYKNNQILVDDNAYCHTFGENMGKKATKEEAISIDENGIETLNIGYSTMYEFYKQAIGKNYIFSSIRNVMYERNQAR